MPRNIVVALRHPDRLLEIDLHVTSSMNGPVIEMMQKPCQELESIRVGVQDSDAMGPPESRVVHNAFLGGSAPRLREIGLHGAALPFPEIRQVLSSTNNPVDLRLSNIPNSIYFSPDDLATALSTLVQLESLTVGFHSLASSPPSSITPPPAQCITLHSLTFLDFRGTSDYLEEFVERIDLPSLRKIATKLLFNQIFELPGSASSFLV
jgi:hypothetical protein